MSILCLCDIFAVRPDELGNVCSVGARAIANLGSATVANFPGVKLRTGERTWQRTHPIKLLFKPVNATLVNLQQVAYVAIPSRQDLCSKQRNMRKALTGARSSNDGKYQCPAFTHLLRFFL